MKYEIKEISLPISRYGSVTRNFELSMAVIKRIFDTSAHFYAVCTMKTGTIVLCSRTTSKDLKPVRPALLSL